MKEAEQTTEVFQMGEITSWIHTIKEVFSEAEQKKYEPALVHLMNRNKTKKDSAKKAELQILELRARLRMREQKPPQPQSNSDKKNEAPFSWACKFYNFEINKDIFVKWRGAPSGIHELAKNPESDLKMLGAKTNPEKTSIIQGEMIVRTIAPAKLEVIKTIINALEDDSDISMVQSEGWLFKRPGEWKKEKYRLILRGFECRAQTMIALTPTHFITKV